MTAEELTWQKIAGNVDTWYQTLAGARRITSYRIPTKFRNERAKAKHAEHMGVVGRRLIMRFGSRPMAELAKQVMQNEKHRDGRRGSRVPAMDTGEV